MNLSPRFLKTFFDLYSTPHFVLSITILAIAVYELPVNLTSEEKVTSSIDEESKDKSKTDNTPEVKVKKEDQPKIETKKEESPKVETKKVAPKVEAKIKKNLKIHQKKNNFFFNAQYSLR